MATMKCQVILIRIVITMMLMNPIVHSLGGSPVTQPPSSTSSPTLPPTLPPSTQPHIIFMVADDMGWNDIGITNQDIISPNLNQLSANGIFLNHSYTLPLCTPSRAALMTGYYSFRTGMQRDVLFLTKPSGLPLIFPTIGDKLQSLGYSTHIIGKWNLGFCNRTYTPLQRGFHSFFGYFQASEYYISHQSGDGNVWGYDFRNNTNVATNYVNIHSSIPFVKQATQIIFSHNPTTPLFMYLPFQYVHSPNQVPQKYVDLYANSPITNTYRRTFQGMVSALDADVGNIVAALKTSGLYNNSIIVFTSDNGGQPESGGNNFPLRGRKGTLFEGGTRVPGFIHSPLLQHKGYVYDGLIHATDWMPTFLNIAGGQADIGIDGINMWQAITQNLPSPRSEIVYNIDNTTGNMVGAIRDSRWKLTIGEPGNASGWTPPQSVTGTYSNSLHDGPLASQSQNSTDIFLFDLLNDPTEHNDVKLVYPAIKNDLMQKYQAHLQQLVRSVMKPNNPAGNPANFNGNWSPGWCPSKYAPDSWNS